MSNSTDETPRGLNKHRKHISEGGRNLIILGLASIVIATITCGLSLYIYHSSGDIYLDRSRPGFLPESTEDEPPAPSYTFEDSGPITDTDIDAYLQNLRSEIDRLDSIKDPFSPDPLEDKTLGIPAAQEPTSKDEKKK